MRPRGPEDTAIPLPGSPEIAELARLPRRPYRFELVPDADELRKARADLDLHGLRKVRLTGQIDPLEGRDWALSARLGATVTQSCIVTAEPVNTRLEEDVKRSYLAELEEPEDGSEIEMPEDDTLEPLPRSLDLMALLHEALALALPQYPRAEGASFEGAILTEPGSAPLTDDDVKPFAGLAGLRDKLAGKADDPNGDSD